MPATGLLDNFHCRHRRCAARSWRTSTERSRNSTAPAGNRHRRRSRPTQKIVQSPAAVDSCPPNTANSFVASHARARETAARGSSSTPLVALESCGTFVSVRHRPHSETESSAPSASPPAPAPHPPESLPQSRRARRPPHKPPGGSERTAHSQPPSAMPDRSLSSDGYCRASSAKMTGSVAISQKLPAICSGEYDSRSTPCSLRLSHRPRQRSRQVHRIRVGEQQPLSPRCLRARRNRVVLTRPPVRQRPRFNHPHAGERFGNLAGAVRRMVIDHDDLKRNSSLRNQRFQA